MLKQILATSALIAFTAVTIQSASAAGSGKFRQLVVEPSGSPAADRRGARDGSALLRPVARGFG
jgi:hypothetical protein